MDIDKLHKYTKGKTKVITFKINPELLKKLDACLKTDKDFTSRSELIERRILEYLVERKKL